MSISRSQMQDALDEISKRWPMAPEIYDLHLGKRDDVTQKIVQVVDVYYQIPLLEKLQ